MKKDIEWLLRRTAPLIVAINRLNSSPSYQKALDKILKKGRKAQLARKKKLAKKKKK